MNTELLREPRSAWVIYAVDDPLVAWLVYRGRIQSVTQGTGGAPVTPGAMSMWALKAIHANLAESSSWWFEREISIELARAQSNPNAVSRLTGFFAFEDRNAALTAARRWGEGFDENSIQEIEILPGSRISRYDSSWIDEMGRNPPGDLALNYARGDFQGQEALVELLVDGEALIIGTEIRERAYATVRNVWPNALASLEIARLGALIGSAIGYITAVAVANESEVRVDFMMNFADATNPDFLERLQLLIDRTSESEINRRDLAIGGDTFGTPDLRSRSLRIAAPEWRGPFKT